MKLIQIKIAKGEASQKIKLKCILTVERIYWNDAFLKGWKVDIEGIPFSMNSFYSPERQKELGV